MQKWNNIQLGEVSDVLSGFAFKSIDFSEKGTPIIKIKNVASGYLKMDDVQHYPFELDNKIKKYVVKNGDILIAMTGSHIEQPSSIVGKSCRYKLETSALLNQRVGKVYSRDKHILNEDFLFYFLKQQYIPFELASIAGGSANQANISPDQIKGLDISLPPLSEQTAIAEILSSLDDKIDLLQRQNKTLEQLAETLFREWFVEEADESWEEKPLTEIATYLNGLACQKYPPKGGDALPVIKIKEMRTGFTDSTDKATANVPEQYLVDVGDVVFSWSGSLDIVIWQHGKGVLNQHLFKVSSEKYPKWFYYLWTKFHLPEFQRIASDKATTMGHIQRHHLDEALAIIPTKETFTELNKLFEPLIEKINENNKQINLLIKTRELLLPKLMSGEVRINE